MREYYGDQIGYYCDDSNHKVFSWKMDGFKFKLKNNTEYVLKVGIRYANGNWGKMLIEPKKKKWIKSHDYEVDVFVSTKENGEMKCNFTIEYGCMIKRNADKYIEGKLYIVPVFKKNTVTIVSSKDCRPNLGVEPKYRISTLKNAEKRIEVCSYSPYDIIISINNKVIKKIEGRKAGKEPSKEYIEIPESGIICIDTLSEEVLLNHDEWHSYKEAIIKVNGCKLKYSEGYSKTAGIYGPGSYEPYINWLYADFEKDSNTLTIRYENIDDRLD
mgnify:FL=1